MMPRKNWGFWRSESADVVKFLVMCIMDRTLTRCHLYTVCICCSFHDRVFELEDPSWAELHYFVKFLNTQLMACEHSVYCDEAMISDRSQRNHRFKSSLVKVMIRMAVVSMCGVCVWACLWVAVHTCLRVAVSGCGYNCNGGQLRNLHNNNTITSVCRILQCHHLNQSMVTKWRLREVLLLMQ